MACDSLLSTDVIVRLFGGFSTSGHLAGARRQEKETNRANMMELTLMKRTESKERRKKTGMMKSTVTTFLRRLVWAFVSTAGKAATTDIAGRQKSEFVMSHPPAEDQRPANRHKDHTLMPQRRILLLFPRFLPRPRCWRRYVLLPQAGAKSRGHRHRQTRQLFTEVCSRCQSDNDSPTTTWCSSS